MGYSFETPEDRRKEEEVIKIISPDSKYIKLPTNDLDYEILGKAFIEIKCRNCYSYTYDSIFISINKLIRMQYRNKTLPTYYFIKYIDCIKYIHVNNIKGHLSLLGRSKERKNSTNDREFIVCVKNQYLKTFNILKTYKITNK